MSLYIALTNKQTGWSNRVAVRLKISLDFIWNSFKHTWADAPFARRKSGPQREFVRKEVQQSAPTSAVSLKNLQLSRPHTRLSAHWMSESQSPWPSWQGAQLLQKCQSDKPPNPRRLLNPVTQSEASSFVNSATNIGGLEPNQKWYMLMRKAKSPSETEKELMEQ